jgi:hypothetical protein
VAEAGRDARANLRRRDGRGDLGGHAVERGPAYRNSLTPSQL